MWGLDFRCWVWKWRRCANDDFFHVACVFTVQDSGLRFNLVQCGVSLSCSLDVGNVAVSQTLKFPMSSACLGIQFVV